MSNAVSEYFRCPDELLPFEVSTGLGKAAFFKFGTEAVCYGRCAVSPSDNAAGVLPDVSGAVTVGKDRLGLPFDVSEVADNLRQERYQNAEFTTTPGANTRLVRRVYYLLRPLLPVSVRRHLQRAHLRGWEKLSFPRWPVDSSVDALMKKTLELVLRTTKVEKIPFIWFWPGGRPACAIMTHDVETMAGRDFCGRLMDMDDSFEIKSAFQVIPEVRYPVPEDYLESLRRRGFEVNVHDLNHDGALFQERQEFLRRAFQINCYAAKFNSRGFRAGAMYRNQEWLADLDFSYDMSVPNVAHLEPQRGGCCTVMPYFIGKILELPMTTTQDYSLFHILGDYSIGLWQSQIDLILQNNGLITFGCHPDYLMEDSGAQAVYSDLLAYLGRLKAEKNVWLALPGDVNQWWRDRHQMCLVLDGKTWRIEGPGRDRARIAYAYLDNGHLAYSFDSGASPVSKDQRVDRPISRKQSSDLLAGD